MNVKSMTAESVLKWGALAIIGIFVAPLAYRFLRTQAESIKQQTEDIKAEETFVNNQNVQTQQETANSIVKNRPDIWAAAAKLAHDLGTAYQKDSWTDWLNPKTWTENDSSVVETIRYQRNNFVLLEKLYQQIYTRNHNLKTDLLKYLDDDSMRELRKYITI